MLALAPACQFNPQGFATGSGDGGDDDTADARADVDADRGALDAALENPIDAGEMATVDAAQPLGDAGPFSCPGGYAQIGSEGHAYLYVAGARQWLAAEAACKATGNHLLVLDGSLAQNLAERALVLSLLPTDNFSQVWIGHSDRVVEGTFRGVTGQRIADDTLPWQAGEPNDFFDNEDCVEMTVNRHDQMDRAGRLSDTSCTRFVSGYVCECDGHAEDPTAF
jgi:hypothetical protein